MKSSEEIRQNGKTVLSGNQSLKGIFNNLIGKSFQGQKYQDYLKYVALQRGFEYGAIEFYKDGKLVETGTIKRH